VLPSEPKKTTGGRPSTSGRIHAANWLLDEDQDEEELQEARDALASYRADAERRFGSIPTLDELTDDLEALNEEFADWVSDRFESDDEDDED